MWLTPQEYTLLGGSLNLTEMDMFKYQRMFEGALHPNTYMVEDFATCNDGSYPLEIKLAMTSFINHMSQNNDVLFGLPLGGVTVGTTSIDYNNDMLGNYGNMKYIITPEVKMILKRTNVLNPLATYKRMKFRGIVGAFATPHDNEALVSAVESTQASLPTLETIYRNLPKRMVEFSRPKDSLDSFVEIEEEKEYEIVGSCLCTYEEVQSSDNTYGYVIAPPTFPHGEKLTVESDWKMNIEVSDTEIKSYDVGGFHTYMNMDELHHTRITLQ